VWVFLSLFLYAFTHGRRFGRRSTQTQRVLGTLMYREWAGNSVCIRVHVSARIYFHHSLSHTLIFLSFLTHSLILSLSHTHKTLTTHTHTHSCGKTSTLNQASCSACGLGLHNADSTTPQRKQTALVVSADSSPSKRGKPNHLLLRAIRLVCVCAN
jgi:ribosomal protein L37E